MNTSKLRADSKLDPRLWQYIERVRAIVREPLSPAGLVRRVRAAAEELARAPVRIGPEHRCVPEVGYGRNLLYKDPDSGFVVVAMIWPAGVGGLPHDHGTWGVVAVVEGEVVVTNFVREDDGSVPNRATLVPVATVHGVPGSVAYVLPPHEDYHSVQNARKDRVAVTIHTYGLDPRDYHAFDLATGAVHPGTLGYHNG